MQFGINLTPFPLRQWIGSALVQIMACCLFGTKSLYNPMLGYCQLDPWEQTLLKFWLKYKTFYSQKCILNYRLQNGGHFVRRRWVNRRGPCITILYTVRQIRNMNRPLQPQKTPFNLPSRVSYDVMSNTSALENTDIIIHRGWMAHICVSKLSHHWIR